MKLSISLSLYFKRLNPDSNHGAAKTGISKLVLLLKVPTIFSITFVTSQKLMLLTSISEEREQQEKPRPPAALGCLLLIAASCVFRAHARFTR